MEIIDWSTSVVAFSAGIALGVAIVGLWLCARAWDAGYRTGRLDERYRLDDASLGFRQAERGF